MKSLTTCNVNRPVPYRVAGAGIGVQGTARVCRDFARGYALGRVAPTSRASYERRWGMWLKWRSKARKSPWILDDPEEHEVVQELAEFMGYRGAVLVNREATVKGDLSQTVPKPVIAAE